MILTKRPVGKPPKPYNTIEDRYLIDKHKFTKLAIPPTRDNFIGSDKDNPVVCFHFGCKVKLTNTEKLFGNTCIHHQKKLTLPTQ